MFAGFLVFNVCQGQKPFATVCWGHGEIYHFLQTFKRLNVWKRLLVGKWMIYKRLQPFKRLETFIVIKFI